MRKTKQVLFCFLCSIFVCEAEVPSKLAEQFFVNAKLLLLLAYEHFGKLWVEKDPMLSVQIDGTS